MARRFHNVLRGYRGDLAKAKFLDHLKGLGQGEKIGTKGPRPPSKKLYVQPFGLNLGENFYLEVSALQPSFDALSGYAEITTRVKTTLGGTETSGKMKDFVAARVVRRQKDGSGTATTSKLTGLRYLKYNAPSVSVPVGRKSATDTQGEMIDDIKITIPGTYSVSFIDERI
jgi:hypothetical protein